MKNNQKMNLSGMEFLSQEELQNTFGGGWFKDLVNGFVEGWNTIITAFKKK